MKKKFFICVALSVFTSIWAAAGGHPEPVQSQIDQLNPAKKEHPFVEEYKSAKFTSAEKKRGFMLFTRPITAPVYPESVPQEHERITSLETFGARGQYVNLNFCIYPLKNISGLLVKDSGGIGKRELRHVAYWLLNYPGYHPGSPSYRRMPTFLFLHDMPLKNIPAREPHRFLLTVKLPDDAKEGIVKGKFTLTVNGKRSDLPYSIRVLPFKLKRDPNKKFSAYNYDVYSVNERKMIGYSFTEEQLYRAQVNQYKRMKEYGFDFPPTLYTDRYPIDGKYLNVKKKDKLLKALKEAGVPMPFVPIAYCHISYFYRKYTGMFLAGRGKGKYPPPKEIVNDLNVMLKQLRKDVDSGKFPEPVFAALDEPVESAKKLCMMSFKAIHDNGFKTMLTEPPFEDEIKPYVDYWNHLYFRPLARVLKDTGSRYWCYPNFNSCEGTDVLITTRGGRMVYGFGMWKSAYNVLMPWIFYWNNLRLTKRSGGNFLTADGRTEMAMTWECFREGIIDGEYIYTLQEAIVRREGTRDPKLKALLKEGRDLLQKMWLQIPWALYYQREGFLTDFDFDGYRTAVADILTRIMRYRELNQKQAPPILVDKIPEIATSTDSDPNRYLWSGHLHTSETDLTAIHALGKKRGLLHVRKIPAKSWTTNKFGTISSPQKNVTRFECRLPKTAKKLRALVVMKTDFGGKPINLLDYDYMRFRLKVSSNRTDKTATWFPLTMGLPYLVDGRNKGIIRRQHPDEGYVTKAYPIYELRNGFAFNSDDLKNVPWLRFFLHTARFNPGDRLTFDFLDFEFIRFTSPVIQSLAAPEAIRRNETSLGFKAVVFGTGKQQGLQLCIRLTGKNGKVLYSGSQALDRADFEGGIPLKSVKIAKGTKTVKLHVAVRSDSGKSLDEKTSVIKVSDL